MTPPVQSITVVLADQRMEPFRPDVTVEWDAEKGLMTVARGSGTYRRHSAGENDFHATVGRFFLEGWRKLVSLSTNVADSDCETPVEKDSASSAARRKGSS